VTKPGLSLTELLALPVSVDLTTAARAFGRGRNWAYDQAKTGALLDGVPIIAVGGRYRVNRADILRKLGVQDTAA
jgi:hypothetical protein